MCADFFLDVCWFHVYQCGQPEKELQMTRKINGGDDYNDADTSAAVDDEYVVDHVGNQ
jgi:hypothetical protein